MRKSRNRSYNRSDRIAVAVLALVMAATMAVVAWLGRGRDDAPAAPAAVGEKQPAAVSDSTVRDATASAPPVADAPRRAVRLFAFDPNTADSATLVELGLSPQAARNVCRYRARGGTFSKPLDLARIYGISVGEYERLAPFITIGREYRPASVLVDEEQARADSSRRSRKISAGEHVCPNTADTAVLMRVPGIGSYYAGQIVRYGQRLGGYVSVEQLAEIDGFPEEALEYFAIDSAATRTLDVNRLSLSELRRHPYVGFRLAKAIVDYRRQHGPLRSLNDVALAAGLTEEQRQRLEPYLTFRP